MSEGDLRTIREALTREPGVCRYHGRDFDRLGFEYGLPRCELCRQPYRITRALEALDRLGDEMRRWVPGAAGYGSGSVSSRA